MVSTFYLKYRPQTIDQLDLASVRTQLSQVLQSDHIPHAFLFSGPRGLGKTSAARILAKAINCETSAKNQVPGAKKKIEDKEIKTQNVIEPCNVCDVCLAITRGTAPDIIEIDGASNRGIDDIRALRETLAISPIQLRKKIYVIDEVHMLTKEAFNALLKTLEEPPEHVLFVLATTEPQRIPATIHSRTFVIPFARAQDEEVIRALQRVIEGEGLTVDPQVLHRIAERVDGGFRDAHKMLEQLAFYGKNVDLTLFDRQFPQADAVAFIHFLSQRDCTSALEWIEQQHQQGIESESVLRSILQLLKDYLLQLNQIDTGVILPLNESETRQLITLCMQAAKQLPGSLLSDLPLLLLVARWSGKAEHPNNIVSENASNHSKVKKIPPSRTPPPISTETIPNQKNDSPKKNLQKLAMNDVQQNWTAVLEKIRGKNPSVAALLKSVELVDLEGDQLTLKVFYDFHKHQLETTPMRGLLHDAIQNQFATALKIKYILGDKLEKAQRELASDEDLAKNAEAVFS